MTVSQDMVGHKLGEFAITRKRFTYKCVALSSFPRMCADGRGLTERRRTSRVLHYPRPPVREAVYILSHCYRVIFLPSISPLHAMARASSTRRRLAHCVN